MMDADWMAEASDEFANTILNTVDSDEAKELAAAVAGVLAGHRQHNCLLALAAGVFSSLQHFQPETRKVALAGFSLIVGRMFDDIPSDR